MTRLLNPTATRGRAPSHSPPDMTYKPASSLVSLFGWFSVALGVVEVVMPKEVSNLTGVRNKGIIQLYGLREIVTGIGLLNTSKPSVWMWGRVLGDTVDIATVGQVAKSTERSSSCRSKAVAASALLAGVLVLDAIVATQLGSAENQQG